MMPLLAMAHRAWVERRRVLDDERFAEAVALGQMLPGPVAVDAITYMAYLLRGGLGALVACVCLVLPPTALVLAVTPLYFAHEGTPALTSALRGIEAVVVALVAAAAWQMGKPSVKTWIAAALALCAFLLVALTDVNPALPLLGGGIYGVLLLRPAPAPRAPAPSAPQDETPEGGPGETRPGPAPGGRADA
jgi:chromate transporter